MPEIKHNFMKGKMNKDLDERLVPNGEYRDAMNIQVSASEGSDVGTVQNILGNSLVAGQDFISSDAVCVGSIADEKNDKLYYFIDNVILDSELANTANATSIGTGATIDSINQVTFVADAGTDYVTPIAIASEMISGVTYVASATISGYNDSSGTSYGSTIGFSSQGGISDVEGESRLAGDGTISHEFISNGEAVRIYAGDEVSGVVSDISVFNSTYSESLIVEYDSKTNSITPVFVDVTGGVLNFHKDNIITGINILDDLLLWTDNVGEPKKINIKRSKLGTNINGLSHTNLWVEGSKGNVLVTEEHITVIKKAPSKAPGFNASTANRTGTTSGYLKFLNYFYSSNYALADPEHPSLQEDDEMWLGIKNEDSSDTNGTGYGTPPNLVVGDVIRIYTMDHQSHLLTNTPPNYEKQKHIARFTIKEISGDGQTRKSQPLNGFADPSTNAGVIAWSHQSGYRVKVNSIKEHNPTNKYWYKLEQEQDSLFEQKFPRFSYRYKYEDNEYSSVGPFTEVVFIPGDFDYHPTKAFNKGMQNNLKSLTLKDFVTIDMPRDVVKVDLLYKNEFSPNIYVVKSIGRGDDEWNANSGRGSYDIRTENIYAQIPSNQLIRPWDNVPKTALAQEITGNRVVYGNYTQNYNLVDDSGEKIIPYVKSSLDGRKNNHKEGVFKAIKSLKSQRTYNIGIVYGDEYGRETPVFTNKDANTIITKASSASANAISVDIGSSNSASETFPSWADYYKVFIKETSNEYYNLAAGRLYEAKDENVWISFPSVDRNKVEEDTYLVLKKGNGITASEYEGEEYKTTAVLDKARYKIVAIENDAPDYLKTVYTPLAIPHNAISGYSVIGDFSADAFHPPTQPPYPGYDTFTIRKNVWSDPFDATHLGLPDLMLLSQNIKYKNIHVSFSNVEDVSGLSWNKSPILESKKYKVVSIKLLENTTDSSKTVYSININKPIPEEESWITLNADKSWGGGGRFKANFYESEIINKPEFDGRFFVKVEDDVQLQNALKNDPLQGEYGWKVTDGSIENLYFLRDSDNPDNTSHENTSGHTKSVSKSDWETNIGGTEKGKWFIDECAYAGHQPHGSLNPKDADFNDFGDVSDDLSDVTSTQTFGVIKFGGPNPWGYGAGQHIHGYWGSYYDDQSIKWQVGTTTGTNGSLTTYQFGVADADYYLQEKEQNWGNGSSQGKAFLKGAHTASYDEIEGDIGYDVNGGDKYLQISYAGIGPNTETQGSYWTEEYWGGKGFEKNWNVGKDKDFPNVFDRKNAHTDDQSGIIKNLSVNKLFRLGGDPNIYKIKKVTKRKLYNYMGSWTSQKNSIASADGGGNIFKNENLSGGELIDTQFWDFDGQGDSRSNWKSLTGLGGYYDKLNLNQYDDTIWIQPNQYADYSASQFPEGGDGDWYYGWHNDINPADLPDMLIAANKALYPSADPYTWRTAYHHQHDEMINPLNCRITYLIKYEVLSGAANASLQIADGAGVTTASDIESNTVYQSLQTAGDRCRLEFVEEFDSEDQNKLDENPAIFETEPKEDLGLDIYYEATGRIPTKLSAFNISNYITIGAVMSVSVQGGPEENEGVFVTSIVKVEGYPSSWRINLSAKNRADYYGVTGVGGAGSEIKFYNDNGNVAITTLQHVVGAGSGAYYVSSDGAIYQRDESGDPSGATLNNSIIVEISPTKIGLGWFNCWSFGNGVESNRIGDTFNKPFITNGVKASTTLLESYKEEHRKHGLIYSGIYNSTSGVNDLNQFIAAEKITKDINPTYGSIQKLHSRSTADGDLITLCEDRVLKILANKDALFNADGNPQLLSTNNVLGKAIPFSGEFGISKNPESFASESYRVYFTDKVRGAVMRLSRDGLTPISDHGMKNWFRDNLKLSNKLIGSYDDKKDEYNTTLVDRKYLGEELIVNGNLEAEAPENIGNNSGLGEWFTSSGPHWLWDSVNKNLYSDASAHHRVGQYLPPSVTVGKSYEISWTVGKPVSGELEGRLWVTFHDENANYKTISAFTTTIVGTYTKIVTVDNSWVPWQYNVGDLPNSINFHNKTHAGSGYFNGTIDDISVREIISHPITVSFKEDIKGWVSFKSFTPENALSMASDYYSVFNGKLFKHHNEFIDRNNFYGVGYNSSINVLLNDSPGIIKTFHTLNYEGSQSKTLLNIGPNVITNGGFINSSNWELVDVVGTGWIIGGGVAEGGANSDYGYIQQIVPEIIEGKRYKITYDVIVASVGSLILGNHTTVASTLNSSSANNNVNLINEDIVGTHSIEWLQGPTSVGKISLWNSSGYTGSISNISVVEIGWDTSSYHNLTAKKGWFASGITTDKQIGSLPEFIEKEGKWFNYISGVDSDISLGIDFGALGLQGISIVDSTVGNTISFNGGINNSLQIGDTLYFQANNILTKLGVVSVVNRGASKVTVQAFENSPPANGDFVLFAKNSVISTSSLLGYYADVKFENNSTDKIELFSIGSEISQSSK